MVGCIDYSELKWLVVTGLGGLLALLELVLLDKEYLLLQVFLFFATIAYRQWSSGNCQNLS